MTPRPKPSSPSDDARSTDGGPATLNDVIAERMSRRQVLSGASAALLFGGWLAACAEDKVATTPSPDGGAPRPLPPTPPSPPSPPTPQVDASVADAEKDAADAAKKPVALGFAAVPKSLVDAVVVPAGYSATVLFALGDPLASDVPAFKNDGTDSAESFVSRAGDHHDGMWFFCVGADGKWDQKTSDRGLLVMNHEAITPSYLHPTGPSISGTGTAAVRTDASEVDKELYVHGVSVVEVTRKGNAWSYETRSAFNRRITTMTPMDLTGPAAGTPHMITRYAPDGRKTRGTVNNCANGWTPWGTYLTCEENWAGYFRRIAATDDPNRTPKERAAFARYGVAGTGRELWATATPDTGDQRYGRWIAERTGSSLDGSDDYRNVANTYGWVVEIDPFAPSSTPKKRTALGRFAHEGAWVGPVVSGKPLVFYMGCDSRNEYIYKFVSRAAWNPSDVNGGLAAGAKYLDEGKLYVAKMNADGTGTWLELRFGVNGIDGAYAPYAFADAADVLVHARLAADAAGATKMDRPEWGAVHPANGEVYFTLTNTNATARPITQVDAANPRFYDDPKGPVAQKGNPNGHVVRLAEVGSDPAATSFRWDVYLFGARASADPATVNLSSLTAENDFSSPDGLFFSSAQPGLLWLETDDGAYTDTTNCMLLAALPGRVGDGAKRTVANVDGATSKSVDTWVGKAADGANLRRFLVGPKECEITGITETPDGRALFVNIQHPGETSPPSFTDPSTFGSHWPGGGSTRPRSATIVITRDDGGRIGTV